MPTMADIAVDNVAATSVTYAAQMPSAGDRSPARWNQTALSAYVGLQPTLEMMTRFNAKADVRQTHFAFRYPAKFTDSNTGLDQLLAPFSFTGVCYAPTKIKDTDWAEGFTQLGNLLVSTLIRSAVKAGYAPT